MAAPQIRSPFTLEIYRIHNKQAFSTCLLLSVYRRVPEQTRLYDTIRHFYGDPVNTYDFMTNILLTTPDNMLRSKYIFVFISGEAKVAYTADHDMYEELTLHLFRNDINKTCFRYPGELTSYELNIFSFDPQRIRPRPFLLYYACDGISYATARDLEEEISKLEFMTQLTVFIILRGPIPMAFTTDFIKIRDIFNELADLGFYVPRQILHNPPP